MTTTDSFIKSEFTLSEKRTAIPLYRQKGYHKDDDDKCKQYDNYIFHFVVIHRHTCLIYIPYNDNTS